MKKELWKILETKQKSFNKQNKIKSQRIFAERTKEEFEGQRSDK